jgi:molybdopterin molybdotransferase
MITVNQAKEIVFNQRLNLATEIVELDECYGRKLGETIIADRDMPPFDRVSMDGIAINFADIENGCLNWLCVKTQYAGEAAVTLNQTGHCIEVMTGAVLPIGCDLVIRYEDLDYLPDENGNKIFSLKDVKLKKHQNIHKKGSDKVKNQNILLKGQLLNATDIALLATVGRTNVLVYKKIRVAVIATGDELRAVYEQPDDFQIRASNQLMIATALKELGVECDQFLIRDDLKSLREILKKCLIQFDIVVITGAVSKGKADFIPSILDELHVEKLFHGVAQRPAKPFWFGKKNQKLVFALPGNPVSAAVCLYVYLIPFLKIQIGYSNIILKSKINEEVIFKPNLTYFMQAKIETGEDKNLMAKPYQGNGSGDLTNLSEINAFIVLPMEEEKFETSKWYDVYFTRQFI